LNFVSLAVSFVFLFPRAKEMLVKITICVQTYLYLREVFKSNRSQEIDFLFNTAIYEQRFLRSEINYVFGQNFKFLNLCGGTLGTAATTGLLYQPRMIGDGDCGKTGGMKVGRGNRSTGKKPAPAPHCPPQISHD
jgi:hypothetical protein